MKKNKFCFLAMAVLVLSFALVLGSCGANPKDLAKQSYELTQQTLNVGTDLNKATALQKKAAAIAEKVEKLSASDRVIYTQELARLSGQGLGEFINAEQDTLDMDTQEALKTAEQALDVAKSALDLLNALGD